MVSSFFLEFNKKIDGTGHENTNGVHFKFGTITFQIAKLEKLETSVKPVDKKKLHAILK
jgi:hypothetical protein